MYVAKSRIKRRRSDLNVDIRHTDWSQLGSSTSVADVLSTECAICGRWALKAASRNAQSV